MDEFETLEDYQNSLKEFNERTRKSYENFIQEHGDDSQKLQLRCTPYTEKKGRYGVASLDFGFQIWQSRQAEVDELAEHKQTLLQEVDGHMHQFNVLSKDVEEKDKRIEEFEEWNKNQARSIKTYQDEDETLKALLQKLIDDEYTTMRPSMAYDIQKALRGEYE